MRHILNNIYNLIFVCYNGCGVEEVKSVMTQQEKNNYFHILL